MRALLLLFFPIAVMAEISTQPLSYENRLRERPAADIELVVIHCTELPDLATAREYGEKINYPASQTGNSGHFYIDRDGRVERWVNPLRIAHHVAGQNDHSIGIELVNRGRYPDWFDSNRQTPTEAYPEAQIEALIRLLQRLQKQYPNLRRIAGHEDLDRRRIPAADNPEILIPRKVDPGPMFPWPKVLSATSLQRTHDG